MKKYLYISILMGLFFFSGCANTVSPYYAKSNIKHFENKNYTINKMEKAFVGESMIREKSYYARVKSNLYMSPTQSFEMKSKNNIIFRGQPGKKLEIMGNTTIDNLSYTVLVYNTGLPRKYESFKLLIDENGYLYNKVLNGEMNVMFIWDFELNPKQVKFENIEEKLSQVDILNDKPYVNYEIVFSGVNKDSMKLLYREFTVDNLARPSFFQELTYPLNSKTIRFRNMKIKINDINADQISYTVLEK